VWQSRSPVELKRLVRPQDDWREAPARRVF
jgi:hypothetical protein